MQTTPVTKSLSATIWASERCVRCWSQSGEYLDVQYDLGWLLCPLLGAHSSSEDRGHSSDFFFKDQVVNFAALWPPNHFLWPLSFEGPHRWYVDKWAWRVPIKLALWKWVAGPRAISCWLCAWWLLWSLLISLFSPHDKPYRSSGWAPAGDLWFLISGPLLFLWWLTLGMTLKINIQL